MEGGENEGESGGRMSVGVSGGKRREGGGDGGDGGVDDTHT